MQNFIVAVRIGEYLKSVRDVADLANKDAVQPATTSAPSYAEVFEYTQADQIARILRRAGHKEAHAATILGMPATLETIAENMR